jgi:hypothetical protein
MTFRDFTMATAVILIVTSIITATMTTVVMIVTIADCDSDHHC